MHYPAMINGCPQRIFIFQYWRRASSLSKKVPIQDGLVFAPDSSRTAEVGNAAFGADPCTREGNGLPGFGNKLRNFFYSVLFIVHDYIYYMKAFDQDKISQIQIEVGVDIGIDE